MGIATNPLNQSLWKISQLPVMMTIPVRMIDQGWHHHGLDAQID